MGPPESSRKLWFVLNVRLLPVTPKVVKELGKTVSLRVKNCRMVVPINVFIVEFVLVFEIERKLVIGLCNIPLIVKLFLLSIGDDIESNESVSSIVVIVDGLIFKLSGFVMSIRFS